MFLLDCNRNFHQNLYYFGLLSTDCLRISQSRRLRFTTNQFWTLFIEGDAILILTGFGDIPSSHGDIPVVSYQIYEVEP